MAGECCVFPFVFEKISYDSCITIRNNGRSWCATTSSYDTDYKWGNCEEWTGKRKSIFLMISLKKPFTHPNPRTDGQLQVILFLKIWSNCSTAKVLSVKKRMSLRQAVVTAVKPLKPQPANTGASRRVPPESPWGRIRRLLRKKNSLAQIFSRPLSASTTLGHSWGRKFKKQHS